MGNCYYDANVRFVQTEYGRQPTFSSFLPGIAGPWGIPTWCNYNNRGQAVCSFGVQDKDHAILEFTAAAAAYQRTPLTGFRTFLKENGKVTEAFADGLGTMTVETVVLLSKGEIDSKKVRVEFSLEDMDMSGFQKGATYEQIKAYVLEHTGLKVSSLYISQIKRKCGLDVGQNYNLSKKEDAKVPKCPPEKEAAIRDALKYFQMI